MIGRWRRLRETPDEGASLILALLIITVVAMVITALLSFGDTSFRTTVALRDQAADVYDADGAAHAAANVLRKSTFNNASGSCFGASDTLALPGYYPGPNGGAASSASVVCTADSGTGAQGAPVPISSANKPGNAILTLGQSAAEKGQLYGQSNKPITIHGGVVSNSTIDSNAAQLTVTGGVPVRAVGVCSGPITPACTPMASPLADPNYPAPVDAPAPPASLPACNKTTKIAEFNPGLYTNADTFNNCQASWIYFNPGTYYFDFTSGSHVWTINQTVVGGTLTAPKTDSAPSVPGACVNPINSTSAVGVQFVFGGDSQLVYAKGVQAEFCASYYRDSIPTVVYGLKSNIVNGANTAHAQSGCVILVGGCDLISDGQFGTKPTFFFEGFVYAPLARINIAVNNTTKPYFNFGMVVRSLAFTTTGSACTPPDCNPFISLPDDSPGYGTADTIVYLKVFVCPKLITSTCSSSAGSQLQLVARVDLHDPSGSPVAGQRQVTVLSWAQQR
jgi:hypothetical protein